MSGFICPVCKCELGRKQGVYFCPKGHSFDISKFGYVNLLMSQQSSLKRHGDDKAMVLARRGFLSKGYYQPLCDALCDVISSNASRDSVIADVGCGEGYYSSAIFSRTNARFYGIDISKDALRFASRSVPDGEFAVASAFQLPFGDKSIDIVANVFAPSAYSEFHRIMKDAGRLIKVVPLEEHLWELKKALYDVPYKNKPEIRNDELFNLVESQELKYEIQLDNQADIDNVFKMTPYYYKTGRREAERLSFLGQLTTTVHFAIEVYEKR
ncbi:MAG: methyltransferase domain-containing protein [Clostridia bacterium]|nr:methyltransferase domain-containing protein [Clostridia bacterium]